jgi:hypothetical protein
MGATISHVTRIGRAGVAAAALYGLMLAVDAVIVLEGIRTAGVPLADGQPPLIEQLPFYVPILLAYSTVGALVAAKRPRNPVGWLFVLIAILFAGSLAMAGLALDIQLHGSAAERAAVESVSLGDPIDLALTVFGFAVLLYPTGHLPSPRWRPVAIFMLIAPIAGRLYSGPGHELFGLATPLALTAPFIRLRHAGPLERRQIEWFVYFVALAVLTFGASIIVSIFDPDIGGLLWGLAAFFVGMTAVAAGIAILRHRLYDIDVLIRRTAIYGATSIAIAATFLAIVLVVQAILSPFTRGNELAVAASTLVSLGLFQPLRRRIQRTVDRRFYRSRYDAERTVDEFTVRLRDQVDLGALEAELLSVVGETLQPERASVWLRDANTAAD